MDINKYLSELDTKRFGFKIAKINVFEPDYKNLFNALQSSGVKLIISRVEPGNLRLINELEDTGFRIKDIQITYKFDIKSYQRHHDFIGGEVCLRDANTNDIESLSKIAATAFKNYGHYAADEKLDKNKCTEIYADWVLRSITEEHVADKIIVALVDNIVAGFLSFKIFRNNFSYAAGGLGAVSQEFRNKNIFKIINLAGLEWACKNDLDFVEHNVLVSNIPVNRVYNKLGFYIKESFLTMHLWL